MKTKEELKTLTRELEALNKKLAELSDEELQQVAGGSVDDVFQRYNEDISDYLIGLLNPEQAYTHAFDTKKPSPLPSDK